MAAKSMTGYGKTVLNTDICDIKVEIKTVNNRYFDSYVRLPKMLNFLEIGVKNYVRDRIIRGKADIFIEVNVKKVQQVPVLNMEAAELYYNLLTELKQKFNMDGDIKVEQLLRFSDVIRSEEADDTSSEIGKLVMQALEDCVNQLEDMRAAEGDNLEQDLLGRVENLKRLTDVIDGSRQGVYDYWFARLQKRMEELEVKPEYNDRIVQEASIIAEKADISEEVTRLNSHVKQFTDIIIKEYPNGKKLDFLCQEFHREFNTIGSKTGSIDIINQVVEAKSEVDKIREQVQNLV